LEKNPSDRTTQEVLEHHLQYCQAANLEETMKDYCEASVIVTPNGPVKGLDEISTFFRDSMENCLPGNSKYVSLKRYICDEIAYTVWKAESELYDVPFGTDTFIIRNGKIVQQSFAGILNKK
jgi:hypothetical protein